MPTQKSNVDVAKVGRQSIYNTLTIINPVGVALKIDFSSLGSGTGKQVDLCGECRYSLKISRRDRAPQVAWLTGAQAMEQYGRQDVKITVRGIKRCARHAARGTEAKARPAFLREAMESGIDINESVDNYRTDILKQRRPNVRNNGRT